VADDLLDRILGEIRARMRDTRGAYEESQQLERALVALAAEAAGRGDREGAQRSQRPRARGGRARRSGRARAGRGANREAILAFVSERPGASAREIAAGTGIARTTVASTVTRLAAIGALERSALPGGGVGFRAGAPAAPR